MEKYDYICIDLKSFYASVECVERGLDPLSADLVVADPQRGDKTICLAVTPSLKRRGIGSRCRLCEIPENISYMIARPRMSLYIRYAADIYRVYLKYFSKDDIYVYSIDEVFIDAGRYRAVYGDDMNALALRVAGDVKNTTGIPAASGIGTNLFLAKVALDIMAKRSSSGVGILDEKRYRRELWEHTPLTDFWRIGRGTADRLGKYGIYNMKQLAFADDKLLYRLFGIDAELLKDHAWGRETVTMEDIKAYRPKSHSITSGQVLPRGYNSEEGRIIVMEMTDQMCLELVEKRTVTDSISLHLGYSGPRQSHAGGSLTLPFYTASGRIIRQYMEDLYMRAADRAYGLRRVNITFGRILPDCWEGFDLFNTPQEMEADRKAAETVIAIKDKYGRDAIFRAYNLEECSTARERNRQIGGHRA